MNVALEKCYDSKCFMYLTREEPSLNLATKCYAVTWPILKLTYWRIPPWFLVWWSCPGLWPLSDPSPAPASGQSFAPETLLPLSPSSSTQAWSKQETDPVWAAGNVRRFWRWLERESQWFLKSNYSHQPLTTQIVRHGQIFPCTKQYVPMCTLKLTDSQGVVVSQDFSST